MSQKSIEHIALYSLVLVGTLVIGVLARQFVLSKGVDDFSSSVAKNATLQLKSSTPLDKTNCRAKTPTTRVPTNTRE